MKKMKKVISILLILTFAVSLAACGGGGQTADNGEYITVTDHLDKEVQVPANAERIAVCGVWPLPSVLAVFFNSAEKIVGMPPQCMTAAENSLLGELYPEILNASTTFAEGSEPNIEELLKLEPDIVFYNASTPSVGEQLEQAGLPAVAVSVNKWDYNCIETLDNWIALLSEIWPDNDRTELVHEKSSEIYNMIQERTADLTDEERAKVFFLFGYGETNIVTSGEHFFGQWWCDAVGAINVANELKDDNSVQVNMEQVYAWNPDTIFITNFTTAMPEDLKDNTIGNYDWSVVDAVENDRLYKMPLGMYRSYTPGVDTPLTLLWMAQCTYPDLFSDIDLTKEVKDYYKEVFDVELTDDQVAQIFTPTAAASAY